SKGGIGMSVGIKGFRIGAGPRGHYVHAGRGGVYYRKSLARAGGREPDTKFQPSSLDTLPVDGGVDMVDIDSGDVLQMRDAKFSDVLDDINKNSTKLNLETIFLIIGCFVTFSVFFVNPIFAGFSLIFTVVFWAFARWLSSYRRRSVLFYDLEEDAHDTYEALTQAFDELAACKGKWHISAGGAVQDLQTWKRNAGATHIVKKKPTSLSYELPKFIASNITPPSVRVGEQILYFLPDVILVVHGKKVGAVGYVDLQLRRDASNFIEEGKVPGDAVVVGHTWKHPNKSGGPDRRFKNNYQIPICLYEVLHLTSRSGLNELLEFSKRGVSSGFVKQASALGQLNGRLEVPALSSKN
ncbi:DUF4236 domain-containing protein, partial [Oceanibaculum nanhaiense]|uniref:DUF4236 domain-containing protein n=1 Tax=Oceanibaculum nanhaiense TaxID=1909734 RepID=UPI00396EBF02